MTGRVLFVCAQNICRSPLMAAAFEDELGDDAGDWSIASAGTEASAGRHACRYSVELVEAAVEHLSSPLTDQDVDDADLVIAASLAERSLIVRMRPGARSKTFTLREALLLGERDAPAGSLAEYAETLDSRRGTLDLTTPPTRPWRRTVTSPLDVADVHHLGARQHRRGLASAATDTRTLARRLVQEIAARE